MAIPRPPQTLDTSNYFVQPSDILAWAVENGWCVLEDKENGWLLEWLLELPSLVASGDSIHVWLPKKDQNWVTRVQIETAIKLFASMFGLPVYEFTASRMNRQLSKNCEALTEQRNIMIGALAAFAFLGQKLDPALGDMETAPCELSVSVLRRAWQAWGRVFSMPGVEPPPPIQAEADAILRKYNLDRAPLEDKVLYMALLVREMEAKMDTRDWQAANWRVIAEKLAQKRTCDHCKADQQLCLYLGGGRWLCIDRLACEERAKTVKD